MTSGGRASASATATYNALCSTSLAIRSTPANTYNSAACPETPAMMRAKPAAAMQKTYDDCYLVCSTAVYFESQNNEAEALRSWKNALDQIYYHNAYRVPANYRPKSETERALQESLRQMELQCKERVDLLEAIKQSKLEAEKDGKDGDSGTLRKERPGDTSKPLPSPASSRSSSKVEGWLGGGTVQPLNYPDLSRPPPLPQRPQPPVRARSSGSDTYKPRCTSQDEDSFPRLTPFATTPRPKPTRTPSPEKRVMLRTLRPAGKERTSSSSKPILSQGGRSAVPAAKAASLAFRTPGFKADSVPAIPLPPSTPPLQPVRKTRKSEPNISAHRKEYSPYQIPAEDAIESARRKHGRSQQSASPNQFPRSQTDSEQDIPRSSDRMNRDTKGKKAVYSSSPGAPSPRIPRRPVPASSSSKKPGITLQNNQRKEAQTESSDEQSWSSLEAPRPIQRGKRPSAKVPVAADSSSTPPSDDSQHDDMDIANRVWKEKVERLMKRLPKGVDEAAARQIFNDIVVQGDVVHWDDVAGLDVAKAALKENVVYPFLRPDLFMGLREPARGMLLFGPPGTGKTMLARAVATESKSTFFAISASSLTSKYLGESEKLVRALFALAKVLAPSIIFVDEIDSLLSARGDAGEHEATRRIKTEFLIQWSDLARAAAGREQTDREKEKGDASRVLVLAATNLPWAIDEAARRRFVRRQYIPLPEDHVRATQLRTLLSHQKHSLTEKDIATLVQLSEGTSPIPIS
jgi:SpoVK/Ycf46/Vps4 family AAA+-type ATPase